MKKVVITNHDNVYTVTGFISMHFYANIGIWHKNAKMKHRDANQLN